MRPFSLNVGPAFPEPAPFLTARLPAKTELAAADRAALAEVPAHVLEPAARRHLHLAALRFDAEARPAALRAVLTDWTPRQTSAADQLDGADGVSQIALTAAGIARLDLSDDRVPSDAAFRMGFADRGRPLRLREPLDPMWRSVDALLLTGAANAVALAERTAAALAALRPVAVDGARVLGTDLTDRYGNPVEHFGWRDGLSQPRFFVDTRAHDPDDTAVAEPARVLVDDRVSGQGFGSYLSLMMFRQDVAAFFAALASRAAADGTTPDEAGAQLMGRTRDGRLTDRTECPFAHVHKMNPRGPGFGVPRDQVDQHRIVRRSFPWGPPFAPDTVDVPRGLAFLAYQSNLIAQIETLYARWAQEPDFPDRGTGCDPLLSPDNPRSVADCVTLVGGAYAYVPPPGALAGL